MFYAFDKKEVKHNGLFYAMETGAGKPQDKRIGLP